MKAEGIKSAMYMLPSPSSPTHHNPITITLHSPPPHVHLPPSSSYFHFSPSPLPSFLTPPTSTPHPSLSPTSIPHPSLSPTSTLLHPSSLTLPHLHHFSTPHPSLSPTSTPHPSLFPTSTTSPPLILHSPPPPPSPPSPPSPTYHNLAPPHYHCPLSLHPLPRLLDQLQTAEGSAGDDTAREVTSR